MHLFRRLTSESSVAAYVDGTRARDARPPRYSCFISHSHEDEVFAAYLRVRLRAEGVSVWFAPQDLQPGKKTKTQIDSAIRAHEKMILVLSRASMASPWVASEVLEARKKAAREGVEVLFPLGLATFEEIRAWECFDSDSGTDIAKEIREYFIPDFSNWEEGYAFERSFKDLLGSLRKGA